MLKRFISSQFPRIYKKLAYLKNAYQYKYNMSLNANQYPYRLSRLYRKSFGETLNLTNPRTYNEKMQWAKLYDNNPLKTTLTDKYLVRDWIRNKIGEEYLIPLLGVWDSFDDIDFSNLPNKFVLKTNHGSGWNIIIKDKYNFDKNDAKRKFCYFSN